MTIRAVIFDLGHTVWDFAPTIESRRYMVLRLHAALEAALGEGAPLPGVLDRALHDAVQEWLDRWNSEFEDLEQPPSASLVAGMLRALGLPERNGLVEELTEVAFGREPEMPRVEPDSLTAIALLDAGGIAMGCVTNTISLDAGIHDALERLGLKRYFRSVVVSSSAGYRKPHESLFRRALDELAFAPQEAVFVGDRLFDDVSGAKRAGMRAVLTHQYRREPLDGATVRPDAVIQRLEALPAVIEQMQRG